MKGNPAGVSDKDTLLDRVAPKYLGQAHPCVHASADAHMCEAEIE